MDKKSLLSYVGILVLSVVVTYGVTYLEAILNRVNNGGEFGFPLKYGTSSFFGGSSFNSINFLVDVIFWFVILLVIWKVIAKLIKR